MKISKKINPLSTVAWTIILLFSVPLLVIFTSVFALDLDVWSHLAQTVLSSYLINSFLLATMVGLGTMFVGTYLAWYMVHYDFFAKRILNWFILLPMAMPAYIIAYTYTGLLDSSGPIQAYLKSIFGDALVQELSPDIRSLPGAIIMMILVLYPYVYLLARSAFKEQSSQFELVAQLAGLSRMAYLFKVTLPLARPAIFTGAALAMMEALADYGTVAYFGVNTFTTGIYRTWFGMGNVQAASQLASLLCLFVFVVLYIERKSRLKSNRYQSRNAHILTAKKTRRSKSFGIFLLCFLPALFGFVIPFTQLLIWAISYFEASVLQDYIPLLISSLSLAGISAVVIVFCALIISYCKRIFAKSKVTWGANFVSLGYALPGLVIAVGVVQVAGYFDIKLNHLTRVLFDWMPGLVISGGASILIFAYALRYLSVALHNTDAGLLRINKNLDEVAASLGINNTSMLKRVHMPLLNGSLLSALILVFVDVLKELPATYVLRPYNINTLAVKAFELASDERLIDAALPAISIVLAGIVPVIILSSTLEKSSK